MKIGVSRHIKISYRPDMQTAIIRWQQPVTFTEFKLNCLAILALAKENTAVAWLVDCRSKGEVTSQESEWLCQEFYPKALQQIAPKLVAAWLLNPRQMQRLKEGETLHALSAPCPDVRREAFLTENEAVNWLEDSVREMLQAQNAARL